MFQKADIIYQECDKAWVQKLIYVTRRGGGNLMGFVSLGLERILGQLCAKKCVNFR